MIKRLGSLCGMSLVGLLLLTACSRPATVNTPPLTATRPSVEAETMPAEPAAAAAPEADDADIVTGIATYLSDEFHGQATASGVPYDKDAMVAAHKSLPFETEVLVTNLASGATVSVVIVDRMPERVESIIDVSSGAAAELGMLESGEAEVSIQVVDE